MGNGLQVAICYGTCTVSGIFHLHTQASLFAQLMDTSGNNYGNVSGQNFSDYVNKVSKALGSGAPVVGTPPKCHANLRKFYLYLMTLQKILMS
jgi:hypothetical protein